MRNFKIFITLLMLSFTVKVWASHNRAGEITFECDTNNPKRFYFTITTYTKASSQADRCFLTVYFCDENDSATFYRVNGQTGTCQSPATMGEIIAPDIRKNIYKGEHTFSGSILNCRIMVEDPNRNADIGNIPNSFETPFFLVTTLTISPIIGINNSPVLLNPPIQNACYCKRFIHNPGAYDPDGDSLSYRLIKPFTSGGQVIPCYTTPSGVTMDAVTGDLVWECPGGPTISTCGSTQLPNSGEFNFAFVIEEWRNGILIGTVERDMQVTVVQGCNNNPPVVEAADTCIVAGTRLDMLIHAHDVAFNDSIDNVSTSATGGPFQLPVNPASFLSASGFPSVTSQFSWQTICDHVRYAAYNVTFLAVDDNPINNLSDSKTININVIGPAPILNSVTPIAKNMQLNWQPYACLNAVGYKIFRKIGCDTTVFEYCQTGMPSNAGYQFIKQINDINTTSYIDDNNGLGLANGQEYSYRLFAVFPDSAESKPSNQKCALLKRDCPVITKASISVTSINSGKDTLQWIRPTEFDSIVAYPPPYKYLIHRKKIQDPIFALIDSTSGINSTSYLLDTLLNTEAEQYEYRIDFYTVNNRTLVGQSNPASTVRLEAIAGDNAVTLNFKYMVPWTNDTFFVYKQNPLLPNDFSLIATTTSRTFTESGLINGKQYCYKVLTKGKYSDPTIPQPLLNFSQIACAIPKDTTSPCAPKLTVDPNCIKLFNKLNWVNYSTTCADDVVSYVVYFTPTLGGALAVIDTIRGVSNTSLLNTPDSLSIAGCYAIAAVDSFNNVSRMSDTICVDNCPYYILPNVFTPDGDGVNDKFNAFPYMFVKDVEMTIFDRWGAKVFETKNPKISWDGKNSQTGGQCSDGTFYYVCTVNEIRLQGIVPRVIQGFIQKVASSDSNFSK
jgi:gliding motility-associated-like protein